MQKATAPSLVDLLIEFFVIVLISGITYAALRGTGAEVIFVGLVFIVGSWILVIPNLYQETKANWDAAISAIELRTAFLDQAFVDGKLHKLAVAFEEVCKE